MNNPKPLSFMLAFRAGPLCKGFEREGGQCRCYAKDALSLGVGVGLVGWLIGGRGESTAKHSRPPEFHVLKPQHTGYRLHLQYELHIDLLSFSLQRRLCILQAACFSTELGRPKFTRPSGRRSPPSTRTKTVRDAEMRSLQIKTETAFCSLSLKQCSTQRGSTPTCSTAPATRSTGT